MFTVIKLLVLLYKAGLSSLNPNLNSLRHAPAYVKYFSSILLACFWCLVFGIYIGGLLTIGYNMIGHIAIISMVFGTAVVFRQFEKTYGPRQGSVDYLRMPDKSSRCDELTDEQRKELALKI